PGSSILELNAGTGQDAIFFAGQGHCVHATDIAEGMLERLKEKVDTGGLSGQVSSELCSFNELERLQKKGPYDLVFSNFAGLNCTPALDKTLRSLGPLVKPGGLVTLVILPRFCLWEFMLLFRGRVRTAFRRLGSGRNGAPSHVEGHYFRCWYYSPSFVRHHLGRDFDLVSLEGLCTIVPPSYIEHFAEKHERLFAYLTRQENVRKDRWPWNRIGDYYIISFRKKPAFPI
ncbi:MAG TPA: class I SAM-dependent methyltransferase, partial [Puia sp.]|nr:class I SAM-dependent methyltransferase [Puia sp.]